MTYILDGKNANIFKCECCDFYCSKHSNYVKHISTRKHQNTYKILTNTYTKNAENEQSSNNFMCECGKKYKHRQSLYSHKKNCTYQEEPANIINKDFIMMILQQNNEILKENGELKYMIMDTQTQMMKVLENGIHSNSHNTINSHNKAFNLNFFLNETCKDAMNIMDFVESIKLQVTDLERIGEVGYVEGISDIIVSNLNKLDITQRPIHCTDKKRETIYIKDAGKWEKDENTTLIRRAIRKVTHNNQRLLPQFKEKYPDYHNSYSSHSDKVTKVVVETMVNNIPEKEEKIIRNIAKSVVLDKNYSTM